MRDEILARYATNNRMLPLTAIWLLPNNVGHKCIKCINYFKGYSMNILYIKM